MLSRLTLSPPLADAAEVIALATERYDGPEPVNVGFSFEISIRDLAARVAEMDGYGGRIVWDATKPNGQPRRKLDVWRVERLFGFRSTTPFEVGLRRTVDWYLSQRPSARAPEREVLGSNARP